MLVAALEFGGIVVMTGIYARVVRLVLRAYKLTLSPLIGRQCRFTPTCSEYAAEVLIGHGPFKGSWLALGRLCRCRPGTGWGYDPAPPGTAQRRWKCEG